MFAHIRSAGRNARPTKNVWKGSATPSPRRVKDPAYTVQVEAGPLAPSTEKAPSTDKAHSMVNLNVGELMVRPYVWRQAPSPRQDVQRPVSRIQCSAL